MTPILGIIASSNQQGRTTLVSAYDSLASVTVGVGGAASVVFTGIPATYTHLEVRVFAQTNRATVCRDSMKFYFNADTGNNYSGHYLYGGDGTTGGGGGGSQPQAGGGTIGTGVENSGLQFGVSILTILDYASTNKNKTMRSLSGTDMNGVGAGSISGLVELDSAAWYNQSPISSITITPGVGTLFNRYSSFALYGVK